MIRVALLILLTPIIFVSLARAEPVATTVPSADITAPTTAPAGRAVIMISVDGLAHFYFDDPQAPMPFMRELAAKGVHAEGGMRASMPTVTWPNHTTLVTGVNPAQHGVVANVYLDRATRNLVMLISDPLFNKDQIVKSPTIYDAAHAAGMSTAAVIWPASRGAKSLDWTVPDVVTDKLFQDFGSPALLAACRQAGIPIENQGKYCVANDGESRDKMYTRMFDLIIDQFHPRLALLHLINVDHIEHGFGPQTPEAYGAIKLADDLVAQVYDHAKQIYGDNFTLIVCSDHGFLPYRRLVFPNVVLKKAGLLVAKNGRIVSARAQCMAQGGSSFVYLLDSKDHDALLKQATDLFSKAEGIEKVIGPDDYAKYGLADPKVDPHMPDLIVSAKMGYSMSDVASGEMGATPVDAALRGTHGYDRDLPAMYATFIAAGSGIEPGVKLGQIDNTRVASTIARLLNLRFASSDAETLPILTAAAGEHATSATSPSATTHPQ